jgi:hypothetical protein
LKIIPSAVPAHLIAFFSFHSIYSSSFLTYFFSSFLIIYSSSHFSIYYSSHFSIYYSSHFSIYSSSLLTSPSTPLLFSLLHLTSYTSQYIITQDIKIGRKSKGRYDSKEEETERKRVAEFIAVWEQYDWTQYA